MATNAAAELESIISEMGSIIKELTDISNCVRNNFKNVGNDLCANCIDRVKGDCDKAKKALGKIDKTKIKE